MKNDQKNPIYPSVLFSCILEQLIDADEVKSIKCHLNINIWSLNLNLGFKPTWFNLLLVALAQSIVYCHVTFMHHIVALHWLCSFFVCRCLSPLSRRVPTMWSMTPMKSYTIFRSARQAKTPLSIPIESHSLAPALFYFIRTTMFQLFHDAVVEPLFLCMTCHCHSN